MADLTITAANVVPGSNAVLETGFAGEALTAGQAVYRSSTTAKWMKADSNSATAEAKTADGIALTGSAANQPVVVQKRGDLTAGATLTLGAAYYLSDTAGGIAPAADLSSGENVCLLGIAKSTSVLAVDIVAPGVTI
jgi:hypothetical protein